MSPTLSWIVIAFFVGLPTLLVGCALRLAGIYAQADADARLARTLRFKHCTTCHHEFDHHVTELDPDLGETHVIETTCLACEYEAGRHIDIDLDSTSVEEIRAIGRGNDCSAMSA